MLADLRDPQGTLRIPPQLTDVHPEACLVVCNRWHTYGIDYFASGLCLTQSLETVKDAHEKHHGYEHRNGRSGDRAASSTGPRQYFYLPRRLRSHRANDAGHAFEL